MGLVTRTSRSESSLCFGVESALVTRSDDDEDDISSRCGEESCKKRALRDWPPQSIVVFVVVVTATDRDGNRDALRARAHDAE